MVKLEITIRKTNHGFEVSPEIEYDLDGSTDPSETAFAEDLMYAIYYEVPKVQDYSLEKVEVRTIQDALLANGFNRKATAAALGIGERTLYTKIQKYGL